jgi:ribosomal protein S18 acetylase RimI-like enzyme
VHATELSGADACPCAGRLCRPPHLRRPIENQVPLPPGPGDDVVVDLPDAPALTWRPVTLDDAAPLQRLIDAIGAQDGSTETYTVEDVVDELDENQVDRGRDCVVGLDPQGTPTAFGLVRVPKGDVTALRAPCWGGVHPLARGRGIGRALLGWQLRRATGLVADRRAELGADVPAMAMVTVLEGAPDGARLCERAGLRATRWFTDLRRPLAGELPLVTLPAGLTLTAWTPELDEPLRLAHNEAFLDHWGSQPWTPAMWLKWGSGHRNFRADWSFAVLDGEQIAGYALSAAYDQEWDRLGFREGWTSRLGVRRPWRGRGVAKALLAASMRAFAAGGMASAGLDVDSENPTGAVALYEGLGYVLVHRTTTWTRPL